MCWITLYASRDSVSMKPASVNRNVGKLGSKGNTSKVTSVVAHTFVFRRIALRVGDSPWRRNATGEVGALWARAGGGYFDYGRVLELVGYAGDCLLNVMDHCLGRLL